MKKWTKKDKQGCKQANDMYSAEIYKWIKGCLLRAAGRELTIQWPQQPVFSQPSCWTNHVHNRARAKSHM